ncbi:MAG TPA: hypothetical protein VET87_13520 [Rubrivivax sp.]|nr:hypothetical protein [Rubrivivax sp.]
MKRVFVLMPMMLPRISDRAAVQLLDILELLLTYVRHHYAPQIQRWHSRQRSVDPPAYRPSASLFDDEPF